MVDAKAFSGGAMKRNAVNRWTPSVRVPRLMLGLAILLLLALCALPAVAGDLTVQVSGALSTSL
jgi:hypothetical protein